MKRLIAVLMIACSSLLSVNAQAGAFFDVREKVSAVRMSMIELLMNKDKRSPQSWQAADAKSAAARAALGTLTAPAGKEATYAEFIELVNTFLDTRDQELRSAMVAGDEAQSQHILSVVQKQRFAKITSLAETLDQ